MNKQMATRIVSPNHLREQEEHDIQQEQYQDAIEKKMLEYLADPITLFRDNVQDFEPWVNADEFSEAVRTSDLAEIGYQLYRRMVQMAKQQVTEDAEKGYE